MNKFVWLTFLLLPACSVSDGNTTSAASSVPGAGILVIAHGSHAGGGDGGEGGHGGHGDHHPPACPVAPPSPWEQRVLDAVASIEAEAPAPVEVAFGMWSPECYEAAIERLRVDVPDLSTLVVVPLFISSHSEVIDMQRWLFGLDATQPFPLPLTPVQFDGEVRYTRAIDHSEDVADILADRAQALVDAAGEAAADLELSLVMHGPLTEAANHRWLAMGHAYAADLAAAGFAEIHVSSLRDDATGETWERAREELRHDVAGAASRGRQALVLPLLLSADGIEAGIHERLEGLAYVWTGETLLPDARIGAHVLRRATEDGGL